MRLSTLLVTLLSVVSLCACNGAGDRAQPVRTVTVTATSSAPAVLASVSPSPSPSGPLSPAAFLKRLLHARLPAVAPGGLRPTGVVGLAPHDAPGPHAKEFVFSGFSDTTSVMFTVYKTAVDASSQFTKDLGDAARLGTPDEPMASNPSLCGDADCWLLVGRVIVDGNSAGKPPPLSLAKYGAAWIRRIFPAENGTTISPTQPTHVLIAEFAGDGGETLKPFEVLGAWHMKYTFDCSSDGIGSGNFQIYVMTRSGADAYPDSGPNALAARGQSSEYEPVGGRFYLEVNSECMWDVSVIGRP